MFKKILLSLLVGVSLSSCGVPQADYDAIVAEKESLLAELDAFKNGEPRLIAIAERSFASKEYTETRVAVKKLQELHPQSESMEVMLRLIKEIDATEANEKEEKELAAKEAERLANLSNTGMWCPSSYKMAQVSARAKRDFSLINVG